MLNYRFDKREKLQGQRFVIGFEERKTMHKKQAANPQWLFLLTAWITFLGGRKETNIKKQNCPCFLAMHLAVFMGTWQKGPNAVRLDTRV